MALKYCVLDDQTGRRKYVSIYNEVTFEVVGSGVTQFNLTGYAVLTASSKIDVFRNGQLLQIGVEEDFTKDVDNNTIVFNYTVPIGSKIKIKVFG